MRAPPTGRQRLRAFRLTDIPLDRRLRAARSVAARASVISAAGEDATPAALLLARLRSDFWDPDEETSTTTHAGLRAVAERPSSRVYWITEDAWAREMGQP